MIHLTRRAAMFGSASVLAACTAGGSATSLLSPANLTTAEDFANGLALIYGDVLTDFPAIKGAPSAATISADLSAAESDAAALVGIVVPATQGLKLSGMLSAGAQVLNLLAPLLPPGISQDVTLGLQAATLVYSELTALVPSLTGSTTVGAITVSARWTPPATMTLADAHARLAARVGRK
jgi:hypothetical protein